MGQPAGRIHGLNLFWSLVGIEIREHPNKARFKNFFVFIKVIYIHGNNSDISEKLIMKSTASYLLGGLPL